MIDSNPQLNENFMFYVILALVDNDKTPIVIPSEPWNGKFQSGSDTIKPNLSTGCANGMIRKQQPQWQQAIGGQISDVAAHPWTVQLSICGPSGCWKW